MHKAPTRAFVLNGVVYDPQDIKRFNGTELHLVATVSDKPILAFDDKTIIGRFWQDSYISSMASVIDFQFASSPEPSRRGDLDPNNYAPADYPPVVVTPPPPTQGSSGGYKAGTFFYEDINFMGELLYLAPGWTYRDLSDLGRGLFRNWDDVISSLNFAGIKALCLCESGNFQGSTYSFFEDSGQWFQHDLRDYGWNDRASSVVTWS